MNKLKDKEKFRREVNKLLKKYRKVLLVPESWKIVAYIHNERKDFATVNYDYSKREFIIHVNQKFNLDEEDLRDTIIHELCHVFLSPYTSYVNTLIERFRKKERIRWTQTKHVLEEKEEKIVKKLTKIIQDLEVIRG